MKLWCEPSRECKNNKFQSWNLTFPLHFCNITTYLQIRTLRETRTASCLPGHQTELVWPTPLSEPTPENFDNRRQGRIAMECTAFQEGSNGCHHLSLSLSSHYAASASQTGTCQVREQRVRDKKINLALTFNQHHTGKGLSEESRKNKRYLKT